MLRKENYDGLMIFGLALTLLILLGFAAYLILEDARVAEAADHLASERLTHGREIYNEQCASCHGTNGEGGVGTALNNKTLLQTTHDDIFFSLIRSGIPSTEMPAWSVDYGGPMTDEDIRSAVAYIRSWEATAPILEPEIFMPTPEEGALIFETNCSTCHGQDGSGTAFGPKVNDPAKLSEFDEGWLREMIQFGRPAQGMPSYGAVLTAEHSDHLVALFTAWEAGETIVPAYNVTDLLNAAIFSLEEADSESAVLQLDRAASVMSEGPGKDMITDVQSMIDSGDQASALESLITLRAQWPPGDPDNGAGLYAANCAVCHGADGEGGGSGVFPPLQPNEYIQASSTPVLVDFILEGREGTAMAGFNGRLTEQEIADIIAYLHTWQP